MSGLDRVARAAVVLSAALMAGCATTTAPPNWLPDAESAQSDAFGGWIEIRGKDPSGPLRYEGELITIEKDTTFVLTYAGLAGVPFAGIENAKLTRYSIGYEHLAAWTMFGTISTLSHGIGLILSGPVWVMFGTGLTAATSRAPQISYPTSAWDSFRPYSRFHDGWPAGFDRSTIRGKAVPPSPARSTKW